MKSLVNIKAIRTLDVETTIDELINGLIKTFELNNVFNPKHDYYWEFENINGVEVLNQYVDISHHGTPCYELNYTIRDSTKIEAYKCIKKLKELVKEGE